MSARRFHARMMAAAEAFKRAGGRHPRVRVNGETIEIVEAPANSTDSNEGDRTQALVDERLGGLKA